MSATVGVRELRQNLSKYLTRIKQGESLVVTERNVEVARLIPSGASTGGYEELASRFGASVPKRRLEQIEIETMPAPAGTTDAYLAEGRRERS